MAKPKRSIAHVGPELGPGKFWAVYYHAAADPPGTEPGVDLYPTKAEAVREAVKWAKDWPPSQIFIHNGKGVIVDERSYGTDPSDSPGARKAKGRRK